MCPWALARPCPHNRRGLRGEISAQSSGARRLAATGAQDVLGSCVSTYYCAERIEQFPHCSVIADRIYDVQATRTALPDPGISITVQSLPVASTGCKQGPLACQDYIWSDDESGDSKQHKPMCNQVTRETMSQGIS